MPARDGTLRVLRAGLEAGAERVVVTSSVAAIGGGVDSSTQPLTEEDWTDLDNPTALALRALEDDRRAGRLGPRPTRQGERDRLAVVNPGAILGPALSEDRSFSLERSNGC